MTFNSITWSNNMNFDEAIRYKALSLKATISGNNTSDIFDHLLTDETPTTRNICAIISTTLFDNVENVTNLLSMSKRQFVEHALIEAVEKANSIINEVNPMEYSGDQK